MKFEVTREQAQNFNVYIDSPEYYYNKMEGINLKLTAKLVIVYYVYYEKTKCRKCLAKTDISFDFIYKIMKFKALKV